MVDQDDLFDGKRGDELKEEGMRIAATNRKDHLQIAREIALDVALAGDGTCDADKVGRILKKDYGIESLGPAAGSLFKTPMWEFTGRWKKSVRTSNHSRMIRVWKLI